MSSEAMQVNDAASSYYAAGADEQGLPTGYKHTEVGVLPQDWDVMPLRALCRQIVDGTHFTPRYVADGVPFYSVENVSADDFENVKFISRSEHKLLTRRCKPERNDILLTRIGSLGDTKLIDWDVDASIYVSLALLKVREDIDARYLYCYTQGHQFVLDVENRSLLNAAPKKINMGDIGAVPVVVPRSRKEQRAIAEALSDVDGLLGALEALIAKKRAIKQAAMQQLLTGKTRLPGFRGQWETKRLGEIAHIKTGSRNNEDKVTGGHYPFFVRSEFVERIDTFSYDCEAILVPGEGRIGEIFHYMQGRFDVHQRVYAITRFAPEVCGRFVYFHMVMLFGSWAMQNTVKATVDSLRLPTFKNFAMSVPPTVAEQTAIATVLSDMDAEIAALEARRDKTQAIKQGMMQQLLTGRVRLVKPEAAA